MKYKKIALAGPNITEKEQEYVIDAVRNGWYETYDMHIKKLEKTFAEYVGTKYAIATFSGTHALHLAAIALDLKQGDEVIVVDQSFIATAHAITYTGAESVFVDIEPKNLCIDVNKIEEAITPRTKAIMLVHFSGFAADMDRIIQIAKKHNLYVMEDAAQAVGTKYKGRHVGSIGDVGAFSFQGAKIVVGGEGGMFVTNNKELYDKAHHYGTFCRNDKIAMLWSDDIGYNYRISNITAALILAQIERVDEIIENKKRIFSKYYECLKDSRYLNMLLPLEFCDTNYCYVTAFLKDEVEYDRDKLLKQLESYNIHSRPGYPCMSLMPHYSQKFEVPVSYKYYKRGIILPTAANLTEEDIIFTCDKINEILGAK
nr:DegT/DnrJ/EryC1/StrS family aminotransferase [uncultured Aminipila sp.]